MTNRRTPSLLAVAAFALGATASVGSATGANANTAGGSDAAAAVTCAFKPVTIQGTAGNNTIVGTAGDDVIAALGGNDLVRSRGGNDTICPGPGRDSVKGGSGDDSVVADSTVDGSDDVLGNAGQDTMSYFTRDAGVRVSLDGVPDDGAPGEQDNIRDSVERVSGSPLDDTIIGSDVANVLDGQAGDDDLRGALGDDLIRGGNDDDLLIGNAGDDFALGNNGDDTALAAAVADGADFFEGGTGTDTASYVGRNTADPVRVSIDNVANDGSAGEGDDIRLDVEDIVGGSGNDTLRANALQSLPNHLFGGFGSDSLDTVDPFIQDDAVDGGASKDVCLSDDNDTRIGCES